MLRKILCLLLILQSFVFLIPQSVLAACLASAGGGGGNGGAIQSNGSVGLVGGSGGCSGGGGGGGGGGSAAGGSGISGAGGGVLLSAGSGTVSLTGTLDARGGNSSTINGGTVKILNAAGCIGVASISAGRIYQTAAGGNCPPSAPTLIYPTSSSSGNSVFTTFQLRSSDFEGDYLKYWIDVCSNNTCSVIVRSICQVNTGSNLPGTCTASQTGWSGQDQQAATAYTGNQTLTLSTLAIHNYQAPLLNANSTYWWRGFAIDPGGSNTWSAASTINGFTTAPTEVHFQGNIQINGNTTIY